MTRQLTFGMALPPTAPCRCGGAYVVGRYRQHTHTPSGPVVARPKRSHHTTVRKVAIGYAYAAMRSDEDDYAADYQAAGGTAEEYAAGVPIRNTFD